MWKRTLIPSVIWTLVFSACLPAAWGTCQNDQDCVASRKCEAGFCVNPCTTQGCAPNHQCKVVNHQVVCSCPPGNPMCSVTTPGCNRNSDCTTNKACISGMCADPCPSKGCVQNEVCRVTNHIAKCDCVDPTGALCSAILLPQCNRDQDCSQSEVCTSQRCVDPCSNYCGANTVCNVINRTPNCVCSPGFIGNPNAGCKPQGTQNPSIGTQTPTVPVAGVGGNFPFGPTSLRKKHYQVITKFKANWYGGFMYCMTHGYRLATIFSREESEQLKEEIRKTYIRSGQFWVSGTDYAQEGKWFWMTTGLPIVDFTDWKSGQPDNFAHEGCLELWEADRNVGYQWNDRTCTELHHFVCEYYE